ncbi:MAG: hypothetical protein ACI9LY_001091 [Arenicella sp.]|jgi:hypothetical protein
MSCFILSGRKLRLFIAVLVLFSGLATAGPANKHYQQGSQIDVGVELIDVHGQAVGLLDFLKRTGKDINVVYIFGGGAMGHEKSPGGIWCPDSFEDLHILRSLVSRYSPQVNFIPVGVPAVYHTKALGFSERALLDYSSDSVTYREAELAYIDSTQLAFNNGIIPVQPYFDPRFRLIMSTQTQVSLSDAYGAIPSWQGAFRAEDETQHYGVPHFWILDTSGKVLTQPFRGNVYHPHGSTVNINYTLKDMVSVIDDLL